MKIRLQNIWLYSLMILSMFLLASFDAAPWFTTAQLTWEITNPAEDNSKVLAESDEKIVEDKPEESLIVDESMIKSWSISTWTSSSWAITTWLNNKEKNEKDISFDYLNSSKIDTTDFINEPIINTAEEEAKVEGVVEVTWYEEEDLPPPPESDDPQWLVVYEETDFVKSLSAKAMNTSATIPEISEEEMKTLMPEDIIDQYVIDGWRIQVTTTIEGVFLKVKLGQ